MNILVTGFAEPELRALSQLLSDAGHGVLAAPGREGARAFAASVTPDVVAIPEGPRGVEVAGWLDPLPGGARVVPVPATAEAVARITGPAPEGPPQPARARRRGKAAVEPAVIETPAEVAPVLEPVLAPPHAEPAVARAEAGPDRTELHPELAAKLTQVRLADYFTLLEVEPDASTWVIREAHERLARRFSARGWPHRLSPVELEALDEVGRGLADAQLVLGDDELRGRYQRALAAAAQGLATSPAGPGASRVHA